jgi:hypothetical protein
MNTTLTLFELKEHIQKIANNDSSEDDEDFDLLGACGGNYDDAYYLGAEDGEISLARELLALFFTEE